MSIIKKLTGQEEPQEPEVSQDPKDYPGHVEFKDEPANPKDVGMAAPGAPMNKPAATVPGGEQTAPAESKPSGDGEQDGESERRSNVEPF